MSSSASTWIQDRIGVSRGQGRLWLLLLVVAFDYGDRTLIGAMGPSLESAFHLSNSGLGLLVAVVNFAGTAVTIPMGILTDRTNRMRLLAIALCLWTVAMGVVGFSISFVMLVASRLFLGIVTAVSGPAIPSLVGDLVPAGQRGRAMGVVDSGQLFGTGAAYLLAALATGLLSFRFGFWLLGIGGGLLAIQTLRTREPERTTGSGQSLKEVKPSGRRKADIQRIVEEQQIAPSQEAVLRDDPKEMSLWEAIQYVFRVKTNVVVIVSRSVADYFFAGLGTFAVVFATAQYHISEQMADLATLSLGIGAVAGVFTLGRLADRFLKAGHLNARVWMSAVGYLFAPFTLLPALFVSQLSLALPAIIVSAFLLVGAGPPLDAVRVDVQVPRLRGRSESIRQVARTMAEGAAPLAFGLLAGILAGGSHPGLQVAFLIGLPFVFLGGLLLLLAIKTYGHDVAAVFEQRIGSR